MTSIPDGGWHTYAAVSAGNLASLYVDGVLCATNPVAGALDTQAAQVLIGAESSTRSFNGVLDEFTIANVPRSSNWVWAAWMSVKSNNAFNVYSAVVASVTGSLPQIADLSSLAVSNTSAGVVGTLTANGASAATVYLCWSTADGTTNVSSWAAGGTVSNLGAYADGTTFTNTLTGLSSNTTYYWNYGASNSVGMAWAATAASPSFRTFGPPGVNNGAGVMGVGQVSAMVSGNLTNGGSARVSFLLGLQDSVWTLTNDVGTISQGAFSNTVAGLSGGTIYYYTAYATNAYGWAVAAPSLVFTTLQSSAYGATIASVSSGFWTNGAIWNPARVPNSTDFVVISSGCSVTNNDTASHAMASLVILTNGVLTHSANAGAESYKVILSIASNLTIDAGGAINADGVGYSNGYGPGAAGNAAASYGGVGYVQAGSATVAKPTYGSITAPTNCGSGGKSGGGLFGGGAILLSVGGTATVNGAISAGGSTNGTQTGGSGGSVFLTTGALTGTGVIRANGGGVVNQGGGGGGRVAVILTNSTSFGAVAMQAYGGNNGGVGLAGAAGTVYLEHTGNTPGNGVLLVNYNNVIPSDPVRSVTLQNGTAPSAYVFSKLILTNGGVYALATNNSLDITSTTIACDPADSNRSSGIYLAGGTLIIPPAFSYSNYFIAIGATNATFNPTTSLTVGTNGTFKVDAPCTVSCPVTLLPGGLLSHSVNSTTEAYRMNLTIVNDLNIQAGAQVNVDGLGYSAGFGPGSAASQSAGSYGGMGFIQTNTTLSGSTYGSVTAPTNCGSAGKSGQSSNGGGAIQLNVSGTCTVNGVISASGGSAISAYTGSGGSVFLTVGTLAGNGIIRANGGGGPTGVSSGSGGRIAVILTNASSFSSVSMQAYSGSSNALPGAAGTVYLQTQAQGPGRGTLLVDAGNRAALYANLSPAVAQVTTLVSSNVTGLVVGTVVITNAAVFQLFTNQSLTVNGSWSNGASFIASSNSTLILASTNTATVAGSNAFYNLISTSAVKTVTFEAGRTNTVQGLLALKGVTLNTTVSGQYTYLTLLPGGAQSIRQVNVRDSNAGGGQMLSAGSGSQNVGHNVNWLFQNGTAIMFR